MRTLVALVLIGLLFLTVWLVIEASDVDTDSMRVETVAWGSVKPWHVVEPPTTTTTAVARTAPTVRARSAAPAVAAARPTGVLQDLIRQGFSRFGADVAEQAVRVAGCESTGDETGNRMNEQATNGQHAGLFQISRTYHEARARRLGFTWDQMWTAEPNIAVAADLFSESGWRPWTCRWAA